LANANFHRGRNTKDTVTVVKERKKERRRRGGVGLVVVNFTAEDPPCWLWGLSLFLRL
jgi:hypothetical protein